MAMCIGGHSEKDHSLTGKCRVVGCPCEHFEPVPEIAEGEPVPGLTLEENSSWPASS